MSKRIYIGNLSYETNEESLRSLFSEIGEVSSVKIIKDETGRSKGFGFVEMTSDADADKAIAALNGTSFSDRTIVVNEARPQAERKKTSHGGKPRKTFGGRGRDSAKWR